MWFKPLVLRSEPKPPPVFCEDCGHRLVQNDLVSGYDPQTGEAIRPWAHTKTCPNKQCLFPASPRQLVIPLVDKCRDLWYAYLIP